MMGEARIRGSMEQSMSTELLPYTIRLWPEYAGHLIPL